MATRTPIVAGNWKMNKTFQDAVVLATQFATEIGSFDEVDMVLCPPFTNLHGVRQAISASPRIALGAQNMHFEKSGAFTGEISGPMLLDAGCAYVILGHSERRQYFLETDEIVARKTRAALDLGLKPIVCVGEHLAERDAGATRDVVCSQIRGSLAGLSADDMSQVVIAYEPVWAIGTGRNATPDQAQEVHAWIREQLASQFNAACAEGVRIQYGGSVKADNAADLLSKPDVDGALVGGASLDPSGFATIVRAAV